MRALGANTIALLLLCLCGCERKELPVPAHDPGTVMTSAISMDANYKWQIYFNLKTNSAVGRNLKTAWDLGFEATSHGYHVILNSSKSMFALNTGKTDFFSTSIADTVGFASNKRWESPTGSLDSTAIADWRISKSVYVIDRGYDEAGVTLGFVKVQFLSVNDSTFKVCFSKLSEATGNTITIKKDSTCNFSFLSFDNNGQAVTVEPPKQSWNIVFTQYTHIFYESATPYLVTGCLLNRYHTSAYKDSTSAFAQITYNTVNSLLLSTASNVIGYDWKTFTGTTYNTNTKMNYIIRDVNGLYYKLHFIDFYNNSGVKGNPKWEYQQL